LAYNGFTKNLIGFVIVKKVEFVLPPPEGQETVQGQDLRYGFCLKDPRKLSKKHEPCLSKKEKDHSEFSES